jgi:hypothetical protein
MRGIRWTSTALVILATGFIAGCQTAGTKQPATVVSPAPAPAVSAASDAERGPSERTISTAPVSTVGFADRHPLFSKPKQYWETSGDNKVVKAAAATFIGVPAGFVGEVKQIFVGVPPETRY